MGFRSAGKNGKAVLAAENPGRGSSGADETTHGIQILVAGFGRITAAYYCVCVIYIRNKKR